MSHSAAKQGTAATSPKSPRGKSGGSSSLERFFHLSEVGTTVGTEAIAGATTFMTCAYLLIVIPDILSTGGIDRGAVTTTTIGMFVLATLAMAFYAKLPFVAGPGIGGAAVLATTLVLTEGVPWQTGMAISFWSGLMFLILTALGMREVVVRIVPISIKFAMTASIGLFIAMLGFRSAGVVLANPKINALTLGNFSSHGAIVAFIGFAIALTLQLRKIHGGLLVAIVASTLAGIPLGVTKVPNHLIGWPHSITPVAFHLDFLSALRPVFFPYLFAFFAAEFFSTMGTTLAVGSEAGMLDERGNMPGINGPFVVDSGAATIGPLFGVPSMTALIESVAGVEAGGRTGLTSVFIALFFSLTLFFSPIILMIPKEATAPALILIGLSMFANLRKVDLGHYTDGLPAILTIVMTLISNNFGTGIAAGLLSYVFVQVLSGKAKQVSLGLYLLSVPLLYFFWSIGTRH